jgi:hypothetical protein
MRTTTLLLASVSALVASLSDADACGSYVPTPRVMQIVTPFVRGEGVRARTFVLTGDAPTGKLAWQRLAPGTYDYSELAEAPDLAQPMEFTLLGPSGAKLMSSKRRAFLQHTFVTLKASAALEIEATRGDFAIALVGRHTGASWFEIGGEREGSATDLAWAKSMGVAATSNAIYVHKVENTSLETLSVFTKDGTTTLVRDGKSLIGAYQGWAVGGISEHGERFIVVQNGDRSIRAEPLYL